MTRIGEVFLTALGDRAEQLQPELLDQLRSPVSGCRFVGRFARAGSRMGLLNALARVVIGPGALLTRCEDDVPFEVELHSDITADGYACLRTTRWFRFRRGSQLIIDGLESTNTPAIVRSRLGTWGRVELVMACSVDDDGALALVSRQSAVRLGSWRMPLPGPLGIRVAVRDGWDAERHRRTIDMIAKHPLIGTVLEYRGWYVDAGEPASGSAQTA